MQLVAPAEIVPAQPPDSPAALSQTAAAYAESMKAQIDKHPPKVADNSPKSVEILMSNVKWLGPDFKLEIAPPQSPDGPEKISAAAAALAPNIIRSSPPSIRETILGSDELLSKLSRAIKDDPKNLSAHLDLQLLHILLGHAAPQMESISTLAAEDRELIAAVIDGFNNFRAASRADVNALLSKKIRPLIEMADRLRSQGELRIANAALCSHVDGFGLYDPIAADRFIAGREYNVILYCEIENFSSQLNGEKQWVTNLTQELAIYNDRGQRLWEDKRRPIADTCRNRRRDFFLGKIIRLPSNLPSGQYSLKISITDPQSNRGTQSTLPIQVVER